MVHILYQTTIISSKVESISNLSKSPIIQLTKSPVVVTLIKQAPSLQFHARGLCVSEKGEKWGLGFVTITALKLAHLRT